MIIYSKLWETGARRIIRWCGKFIIKDLSKCNSLHKWVFHTTMSKAFEGKLNLCDYLSISNDDWLSNKRMGNGALEHHVLSLAYIDLVIFPRLDEWWYIHMCKVPMIIPWYRRFWVHRCQALFRKLEFDLYLTITWPSPI